MSRSLYAFALTASLAAAVPAAAQRPSDPGQQATTPAAAPATSPAAVNYLFPDLGPTALVHDGKYFWIRPIFAVVGDYTAFTQDDASLTQVGMQDNTQEFRAVRIGLNVRTKGKVKWNFLLTTDYQESRTRVGPALQVYDARIGIPLGPVMVQIGKQKELFAYEMVGLSVVLPQQERILLPFFVSRNIGVNFGGQLAGGRMTWSAGVFNDWLQQKVAFSKNATNYVGRVSALARESPDKTKYVHLALGLRGVGSDDGTMRFAGRPESNVATKFTDTKDFPADGAKAVSLEGLVSRGRFSVLTEYISAWVDAPQRGNPFFYGYYVAGSWILTGESRPYNRMGGYAGGVVPTRRLGAVELVAKFSHVDLTDGPIEGGVLDKWHFGVSWWASAQWKVGLSYGDADLNKTALTGNTKMWLTRVQWLY